MPASTQWEMVKEAAEAIEPVSEELIRQAAQGEVLHNDDTTAVILETIRERRMRVQNGDAGDPAERTERSLSSSRAISTPERTSGTSC